VISLQTTLLGQVSLDLAEQGINVLWGSFEIKNTRLIHKLLKQFARDALPSNLDPNAGDLFNSLADRFEALPFYFMRFHGGSDVDEVLDAMEYAVYVFDVEHIVLVSDHDFVVVSHFAVHLIITSFDCLFFSRTICNS
jgi:twinkle protein